MKLKTKVFIWVALITIIATGSITIYSTLTQRNTHIENELKNQRQVINLLSNAVAGQYYNYLNQQVFLVFSTRSDLEVKAQIIKNFISQISFDEAGLDAFLAYQQKSLNQVSLDLIATKKNNLLLPPFFNDINTAKSVGDRDIIYALNEGFNTRKDGYFLALFNENTAKGNYLSYTFVLDDYPEYRISILQNINQILEVFSIDDDFIISQLRNSFMELGSSLEGTALIANADTNEVIISSKDTLPFISIPEKLRATIAGGILDQAVEINIEGKNYYLFCSYYKPLRWYIMTLRLSDEVVNPAFNDAMVMLSIGLTVLLLALLLSLVIANGLTKRLSQIADKAGIISKINLSDPKAVGSISEALDLKGSDEVAQLSRAIASMANSISDNLIKLFKANKQKDRLLGELDAARQIQLGMLLPQESLPKSEHIDTAAFLLPAKEVGGDFYDVFRLDEDRLTFAIGDVSDKGVGAALFMSMTMNLVHTTAALGLSPAKIMERINSQLSERNPNMMFVTMFVMILNEKTGSFTASNAGHCLPIVISKEGIREMEEVSGPAVGPIDGVSYTEFSGVLQSNDTVVLYTDGISEAQNENQEFFTVKRIIDSVGTIDNPKPQDCLDMVLSEVARFRGSYMQTDDITMLCFKRT